MRIQFTNETGIGKVLLNWWEGLEDDRASRDILRRASSITAVSLTPSYQRLYQRLLTVGWSEKAASQQNDRLAAVAGLLVHVEQNDGRAPAKAMSQKDSGHDRPPVS